MMITATDSYSNLFLLLPSTSSEEGNILEGLEIQKKATSRVRSEEWRGQVSGRTLDLSIRIHAHSNMRRRINLTTHTSASRARQGLEQM